MRVAPSFVNGIASPPFFGGKAFVTGSAIVRTGEPGRLNLAVRWYQGELVIEKPALREVAAFFGVRIIDLRKALEAAGWERRTYKKRASPAAAVGDIRSCLAGLTADQILDLAVAAASTKANGNGSTQPLA
jgi:hypothetical protein